MTGFMSGFGKGFSDAFNAQMERGARERNDMFRVKFSEYQDRRKEYEEQRRNDDQAWAAAQELAGENPASVNAIYNRIRTLGLDKTTRDVETGRLVFDEDYVLPEEVKSQTEQAVGVTSSQAYSPNPVGGNWADQWSPDTRTNRKLDRLTGGNYSQVMSQDTSQTREDREGTRGWYFRDKEPDPVEAASLADLNVRLAYAKRDGNLALVNRLEMEREAVRLSLMDQAAIRARENGVQLQTIKTSDGRYHHAQIIQNPDGSVSALAGFQSQPLQQDQFEMSTPEEAEGYRDAYKTIQPKLDEYNLKAGAIAEAMDITGRLARVVDPVYGGDPRVLTSVAGATERFSTATREAVQGVDILNEQLSGSDSVTESQVERIEELESTLDGLIATGVQELGERRAIYNAMIQLAGYKFAAMNGQDGRALSDTDVVRFLEIAGKANKLESFRTQLSNAMSSSVEALEVQRRSLLAGTAETESFREVYGNTNFDFSRLAPDINFLVENGNDFTKMGWEFINQELPLMDIEQPQSGDQTAPSQDESTTSQNNDVLKQAQDAISRGAPRDKVIERLESMGIQVPEGF